MSTLDPLARGCTVAVLLLIALVLLRARPRAAVVWVSCGLFASIASYLVLSSPDFVGSAIVKPLLQAAALATPATFSFFTRAFFGDDDRFGAWDAVILVAVVAVGFGRPIMIGQVVYYVTSVALVGLALTRVVRGLSADLVEPRRRIRAAFTIIVGIEILIVLGAELWLGSAPASRDLELLKSVAALGVTLAFGAWLLTPRGDLLAPVPARETAAPLMPAGPQDTDARFRDRLLAIVQGEQLYKQEGLTIGRLARKLDLPEYRVRRIINQQLGYRNFNAFLNELRTDEACRLLADPANERLPIFNLALDLGYGSLGPFNRAFRARTGQTPTEYRQAHLEAAGRPTASPAES
jgi:AraC-like DNA-binding protein